MPVNKCCCGGHNPPDCCSSHGCCFDLANTRLQGHIYFTREYFAALDGTGPVVHTLLFEADYDLEIQGCISAGTFLYPFDTNLDGSPLLKNIVLTWDGVPQTIGGGSTDLIEAIFLGFTQTVGFDGSAWDGTNWEFNFFMNQAESAYWNALLLPLLPSSQEDLWNFNGASDNSAPDNFFPGDCTGFPLTIVGPNTTVPADGTYSVTTTVNFNLNITKNYCCYNGVDCAPRSTPNEAPDGSC